MDPDPDALDPAKAEETPDERAWYEELTPGRDEVHTASARARLARTVQVANELLSADNECPHGHLPVDRDIACDCWTGARAA